MTFPLNKTKTLAPRSGTVTPRRTMTSPFYSTSMIKNTTAFAAFPFIFYGENVKARFTMHKAPDNPLWL